MGKHKSVDCIPFLGSVDKKRPRQRTLRIVVDDHAAHKTLEIRAYLEFKEGRFVEHFIPTHSSWPNLVKRWCSKTTSEQIRRESWSGVPYLKRQLLNMSESRMNLASASNGLGRPTRYLQALPRPKVIRQLEEDGTLAWL